MDIGNNESCTVIQNVCITENYGTKGRNISIKAYAEGNLTNQTIHGFKVLFTSDARPYQEYSDDQLAILIKTVPWMYNLHHFTRDVAITLYAILTREKALYNRTNR